MTPPTHGKTHQSAKARKATTRPKPQPKDDEEYRAVVLRARLAATYGAARMDMTNAHVQDPGDLRSRERQLKVQQLGEPQAQDQHTWAQPPAASTQLRRPEMQATVIEMAMASQAVTQNLKSKNYSVAIVAPHLTASRIRDEVDQWPSGTDPRPRNWKVRTNSFREQSDPRAPHMRVIHTHTTISPDGATLKLSGPAWICENCNDMSVSKYCPCFHWPAPGPDPKDHKDHKPNSQRGQLQKPEPPPTAPTDQAKSHNSPLGPECGTPSVNS